MSKDVKFLFEGDDGGTYETGFSPETIEKIMSDWEREHPGQDAWAMPSNEFADKMMAHILASFRKLPSGKA